MTRYHHCHQLKRLGGGIYCLKHIDLLILNQPCRRHNYRSNPMHLLQFERSSIQHLREGHRWNLADQKHRLGRVQGRT